MKEMIDGLIDNLKHTLYGLWDTQDKSPDVTDRAWIEINLHNLKHNVLQLKSAMPSNCQLMAVVKADAYGHNAYHIATCLQSVGVNAYAVATIDEGISLRQYGITGEILVLGYTAPDRAKELVQHNLLQTLIDYDYAQALEKKAMNIKAHIKIDTGMHRLGYDVADFGSICNTFMMPHIRVEGIYTHLCVADSKEDASVQFTQHQIESFRKLLRSLKPLGIKLPKIHIQSSYGLLNYPGLDCDYVRAGIALYGTYSSPDEGTKLRLDLRPVLSLKSRVILIRTIAKGDTVGYGRSFIAEKDTKIAIIPIGYADGIPRNLSCGKGAVLINGRKAPIVGRICMDQLAVDITEIPYVRTGMVATLIGSNGDQIITAAMMAEQADTITNELLCRLGQRINISILHQ